MKGRGQYCEEVALLREHHRRLFYTIYCDDKVAGDMEPKSAHEGLDAI